MSERCQLRTHAPQRMTRLFNYLVRAGKQCWRDADIQGTSRFYIDHQLELCRLLDGKVGSVQSLQSALFRRPPMALADARVTSEVRFARQNWTA
jgi:hypothetical protein